MKCQKCQTENPEGVEFCGECGAKLEKICPHCNSSNPLLSVSNNLVFQAAEYKAEYNISYADCFILASAMGHKAIVVTGDPEFKKVKHLVEIVWV